MGKRSLPVLFLFVFAAAALSAVPFEIKSGKLKLTLYDETGTFTLYYLSDPEKNRYEPLLFDQELGKTTAFYVKINGRVTKLQKKIGVRTSVMDIPGGGRLIYNIAGGATVTLDFFLTSSGNSGADTVRIDASVENIQERWGEFSLKGIFDTMLGENMGIHFSTAVRDRISSETELKDIRSEQWVLSAGRSASLKFIFTGQNVSVPETISAANRERLHSAEWVPNIVPGRNFNSSLAINDSALGVFWPAKSLNPMEKMTVRMYMVAGPGVTAAGRNYAPSSGAVDFIKDSGAVTVQPSAQPSSEEPLSGSPLSGPPSSVEGSGQGTDAVSGSGAPDHRWLTAENITDDMLDITYIQSLFDRIDELSKHPDMVTQDEISLLNAELDLIFEKLENR
ncbi:MAG: hypothetical protein LBR47_03700 [Spirochaetaceae bacterium]|jgi:hypothetical protein|nr:hypothetical protein [Spirochaetaceae bacterium]